MDTYDGFNYMRFNYSCYSIYSIAMSAFLGRFLAQYENIVSPGNHKHSSSFLDLVMKRSSTLDILF